MFEFERKKAGIVPVERAVLFSLAAHLLFFVFLLSLPERREASDPRKGLLAALVSPEEEENRIPVEFREAPGPARENPKESPRSDLNRRAGGGDPSRSRGETPYVPPAEGISGLARGAPGLRQPPPAGAAQRRERAARSLEEGRRASEEMSSSEPFVFREPRRREKGSAGDGKLSGLEEAIREAAEGVGAGDQGAGFPNPEGGFVDSGPLSFDSAWYDWGPYAAEMVRRIKLHWEIPSLARLGWKGKLTIRFFILADGRVEGATILSRSGVPPFDFAALQAILKSSPFRPLPKDLGSPREGVTVTFFYNIRPGQTGETEGAR